MGAYISPIFCLIDRLCGIPERRKNRRRLAENMQYLRDCTARGVSPYENLEAHLAQELKNRGGGTD